MKFVFCLLIIAALSLPGGMLIGQNTSSVFSPDVTRGKNAIEYRAAYDSDAEAFSHRLHYQYGFTDAWRGRVILTQFDRPSQNLELRYIRFEGLWQFLEDGEAGWDSALRFELQLTEGDNPPHRARIAWSGKKDLNEKWQIRGNFLTGRQFGNESKKGWLLESRAQITRKLNPNWSLAVDYFGDMNDTDEFGAFKDQEHQLGPLLKFKAGGASGLFGPLFGVSSSAPDLELRCHLIWSW